MAEKIIIKITTDPDGFLGGQDDPTNGKAIERYQNMVTNAIHAAYPGAEVEHEFEPTMNPGAHVESGEYTEDIEGICNEIADRIYNEGKFWG